jgi:outer membrane receptor protein involved in Fe transport
VLGPGAASAQETSAISGTVTHAESGRPVEDVVVTAESPALPTEQVVVTDAKGQYAVEGLPPGTYTLRFEGPQSRPFSRAGITVRAGTPVKFDVQLAPDELQEEVIVTGSRIPRPEVATAAPVTVVGRNQIETAGRASIGDILQQLPSQGNATNTQVNNGGEGATRINLRNLGTQRTLTLVNGRRFVAGGTGANASVDLGTIPTQAIERIEVLKDGASAAYGSDAISGVVNIITRKDYSGTELQAFGGLSSRGDALQYDLSFTAGVASEKGNILFSAGFFDQREVFNRGRGWAEYTEAYDFPARRLTTGGSVGVPETLLEDFESDDEGAPLPGYEGNALWQSVRSGSGYYTSDRDASGALYWRDFSFDGTKGRGGDQYNFQPANYLLTPNRRINAYATGGYALGEKTRGFFELSYTHRAAATELAPEPLFTYQEGVEVSADNFYNPFGRPFGSTYRRLEEFGPRKTSFDVSTFRTVVGAEGSLPALANGSWDVSLNYGRTSGLYVNTGNLQRSKVAAALGPSMLDPETQQPICVERAGDASTAIDGCVPLNLFGGKGSITPEQVRGLAYTGVNTGYNQQLSAQANASGELLRLFNARSAVGVAAGLEHRREAGLNQPNPLVASGDTTGNKAEPTGGSYYVNEAYAELSVPLVGRLDGSNAPGDLLEVNAAVRGFHYSNFGGGSTYKLGARVSPVQDVTLRGTVSNAFRAPSIAELYAGEADSFITVRDPCAGGGAAGAQNDSCVEAGVDPDGNGDARTQLLTRVGGNRALRPETALTYTAGVVVTPRAAPDFSATVDVFSIDIQRTIATYGPDVLLALCHPTSGAPDATACSLIERNGPNRSVSRILDLNQNVGAVRTSGMDLGLRYEPQTAFGRIGLRADFTYLDNYRVTTGSGRTLQYKGNYDSQFSLPDWRGLFGVAWALAPFNAGVSVQWLNGHQECEGNACNVAEGALPARSRAIPAYFRTDLNLGMAFAHGEAGKTGLALGVTNLFDVEPPAIYNNSTYNSDPATYDFLGRYFFARVTHSFY